MSKTVIKVTLICVLLGYIVSNNIDIHAEEIHENKLYTKQTKGAQLNAYELTIPAVWQKSDLVIESNIIRSSNEFIKNPLVIISLESLTSESKDKQWICNQIGKETCFLPANHLEPGKKVYIGVFCKDCEYTLKYLFKKETSIQLGQNTLFHLKAGDSKVFTLTVSNPLNFKDYISISSFNLKQTNYEMKVEIVNTQQPNNLQTANVNVNWIGGQQAMIYPKNFIMTGDQSNNLMNYSFKIIITAHDNGVFNLEAVSGNTIIALDHFIRFDSASEETPICYSYSASDKERLILDVKSINGNLTIRTQDEKLPAFDDFTNKFTIDNGRDEKISLLNSNNAKKIFICVESAKVAYYTIHIYNEKMEEQAKTYKNLLLSKLYLILTFIGLLKSKEMYSISNIQGINTSGKFAKRVLQEAAVKEATKQEGIHITGNGVAGLITVLFLAIPVIIVVGFMDSVFVNTKLVEKPLLVGKIDY